MDTICIYRKGEKFKTLVICLKNFRLWKNLTLFHCAFWINKGVEGTCGAVHVVLRQLSPGAKLS